MNKKRQALENLKNKHDVYKKIQERKNKLDPETYEAYKRQMLKNEGIEESEEAEEMDKENERAKYRLKVIKEKFKNKK